MCDSLNRTCFVAGLILLLFSQQIQADPIPVRISPLSDLLRQPEYSAPASVTPLNAPSLAAQISAQIDSIPVRVGDRVEEGDLVARLDCRYHESILAAARAGLQRIDAQLAFARAQLQRAKNLKSNRNISEELLDQRNSELLSTEAQDLSQRQQIRQAEIDVQRCRVTAPFEAVVTERLAQEGGLANSGTPLVKLLQLDKLEVSAELRGSEAESLRQADSILFRYAGKDHPLRLRHILPQIDTRTRTQQARLIFLKDPAPAGAAGRLIWQGPKEQLAADYLVRRDGRLGVFLAYENSAHFHPLPQAQEGQPALLQLKPSLRLITEGRQRLQHGDSLTILKD
jgi:RND family efflux transporter MFP subunit